MNRQKGLPAKVQHFLVQQKVASFSVAIDHEGTIHEATMWYYHSQEPLTFYFITSANSLKCTLLTTHAAHKAAVSVGGCYGTAMYVQFHGEAILQEPNSIPNTIGKYNEKRGKDGVKAEGRDSICIVFTPQWGRYTDYSVGWDEIELDFA